MLNQSNSLLYYMHVTQQLVLCFPVLHSDFFLDYHAEMLHSLLQPEFSPELSWHFTQSSHALECTCLRNPPFLCLYRGKVCCKVVTYVTKHESSLIYLFCHAISAQLKARMQQCSNTGWHASSAVSSVLMRLALVCLLSLWTSYSVQFYTALLTAARTQPTRVHDGSFRICCNIHSMLYLFSCYLSTPPSISFSLSIFLSSAFYALCISLCLFSVLLFFLFVSLFPLIFHP